MRRPSGQVYLGRSWNGEQSKRPWDLSTAIPFDAEVCSYSIQSGDCSAAVDGMRHAWIHADAGSTGQPSGGCLIAIAAGMNLLPDRFRMHSSAGRYVSPQPG